MAPRRSRRGYGAPAPPVGLLGASDLPLEGSAPPLVPEVAPELSVPAAPEPPVVTEVSPAGPLVLSAPPEVCSPVLGCASLAGVVALVPVVEDLVVAVVAVVLVRVASLSAEVLLGGVISGVLRGVASETPLPPQAASVKPQARISAHAPSALRRALTLPAGPSAGRKWGSR
jgi:hypothetical protein